MINENTPTIKTERLILRKFTKDDAQALFEILNDPEVNIFLPWFASKSLDETKVFLQKRFLSYYDKPSIYRYAICLQEDNIPIGYAWLSDNESCDFGYGLKKEFWHMGIVTEAAKAVVERIKNAGYRYITATHDINNPRSGNVMKKIGMDYRYSYDELWQPKNFMVTFRMYQIDFNGNEQTYTGYQKIHHHFIESIK